MKKSFFFILILGIAVFSGFIDVALSQSKRALLIGIERYSMSKFSNLNGPINDVRKIREILITNFQFESKNIDTLMDEKATGQNILKELEQIAIESQKGDIVFIYYSGHGSTQYNSLSNPLKQDEGFVPYDFYIKEELVRDKQINTILNKVIDKGAILTCMYDCCHSGGLARGLPVFNGIVSKFVPLITKDAADTSSLSLQDISNRGALMLLACRRDQNADCNNKLGYSYFTEAFCRVFDDPMMISQPVSVVYSVLTAKIRSMGTEQEPQAEGMGRMDKTLPGIDRSKLTGKMLIPVINNYDGEIYIQAGKASGMDKGCLLKKYNADSSESEIELEVLSVLNLNYSHVKVIRGRSDDIKSGELFYVKVWKTEGKPILKVYIPHISISNTELLKLTGSIVKEISRKATIIEDPARDNPTVTLYYDGGWFIDRNRMKIKLGESLDWSKLPGELKGNDRLCICLPLGVSDYARLKEKFQNEYTSIEVSGDMSAADYCLVGRYRDNRVEYAWIKGGSTYENYRSTLPLVTDWIASDESWFADRMSELCARLGKVNAWLELVSKDSEKFPYTLTLRKKDGSIVDPSNHVSHGGDEFEMILKADDKALSEWEPKTPRYVYVLVINSNGGMSVLYPADKCRDAEKTRLPVDPENPEQIISLQCGTINCREPFGTDTFILLTTDSQITDYKMLTQEEVQSTRSTSMSGEPMTPLEYLLHNTGAKTRSGDVFTSTNWSVQRFTVESRGRK